MNQLPFDDRPGSIWMDGALVAWRDANLHAMSHSLHFASSVFEGIRVYGGVPFRLTAHIERFFISAKLLDYELPFSQEVLEDACRQVVKQQKIKDGYIRPVAWRGAEFMAPSAIGASIHVAIAAWPWPIYYSADAAKKGIRLKFAEWRRPAPDMAPTQAKASGLYQICTLAKNDADRSGYDDALMLDYRGYIAETTSSNIFFVIQGKLFTPKADCFLNGITRQIVIALAKDNDIEVVESHIEPTSIQNAEEAFITGTAAELTPVSEIDDVIFKRRIITNQLRNAFNDTIDKECHSSRIAYETNFT